MKNKLLALSLVGLFSLSSCGLGTEITQEQFVTKMSNIPSSYTVSKVIVSGNLQSRNADIESNIGINFEYTYVDNTFVCNIENDLSKSLIPFLSPKLTEDFGKAILCEIKTFYDRGSNVGFAISFENELKNGEEFVGSYKNEYQYDVNGLYTNVYEFNSFVKNNTNYVNKLTLALNWTY